METVLTHHGINAPISAFITNIGKYAEGEMAGAWLSFPTTPEALARTFEKIGVDGVNYEEWFITDYKTDIDGISINEYDNLDVINYLANILEEMPEYETEQLKAILEYYDGDKISDVINLSENLDCFYIIHGVFDEEELGCYLIEERGDIDTSVMGELAQYIDYESYGRDYSLNASGDFTDAGFVEKTGDIDRFFDGAEVPDEYRVIKEAREIIKERQQEKAKANPKKSITARLETDREEKKTAEKSAPTVTKNNNELDL